MLKNRRWAIAAVLVVCTSLATIAEAQLKMPFRKRASTASTVQDIQLTQANGPWLVMCASFDGERGLQQAMQLATELRNDHGLNAYLYRHTFDHSEKVQGSGWTIPAEEAGLPARKNWKASSADLYQKVAVVVGDFATAEDRSAKNALQKIKMLSPRSMVNNPYAGSEQSLEQQFRAHGRGPLSAAFLMPNPMLPSEYFNARNIDEEVLKLNKGVKYSLLKCQGQYTVRVATFTGNKKFNVTAHDIQRAKQEDELRRRDRRAVSDSESIDALYKANLLCRALRKKGVEAWEFHDRHESYVCVGSFDWATRKLENGKDYLNPEMADIIRQYKATPQRTQMGTTLVPRTIAAFKDYDIHFEAQPMPIVVPKVHTARRGRGLFGR